jgi:hypothetical protein
VKKKNLVLLIIIGIASIELFGIMLSVINLNQEPFTVYSLNGLLGIYGLIEPKSSLELLLATNSTAIQSGQAIGIKLSLYDNSSLPLYLPQQDKWAIGGLGLGGCSYLPMGIAILQGYYTENNMTNAKQLPLYFLPPCPPEEIIITGFTMQPHSYNATVLCESTNFPFPCPTTFEMKSDLAYSEFLEGQQFQNFKTGTYTIVGGDEWGDIAIRHFVVTNPEVVKQ